MVGRRLHPGYRVVDLPLIRLLAGEKAGSKIQVKYQLTKYYHQNMVAQILP